MLQRLFIILICSIDILKCYRINFNLKDSDVPGTDFYKVAVKGKNTVHSTTLRDTDEVGGSFEGYADFEDYQDYDYYGYPTDDYGSAYGNDTYEGSVYDSQVDGGSTIKDKDRSNDTMLSESEAAYKATTAGRKHSDAYPQVSSPTEVSPTLEMTSGRTYPKF